MSAENEITQLLEIMAALRTPGSGCPWDLAQNFRTIAPYTIEEAYEVADAIERGDLDDLKDELGDLLLQVVFHARMAEEQSVFGFADVVSAISAKLLRRHPHVFGDAAARTAGDVPELWERIKSEEKAERLARRGTAEAAGVLAGVPAALPALTRALKLQRKAAAVGFDWGEPEPILDKIREEADEIAEAARSADPARVEDEVGDLLFAVVNLARQFGVDPENALRCTNAKFSRRFEAIERRLAETGRTPADSTLAEMDALWEEAKRAEKAGRASEKPEGKPGQA